jgi:hypothetical protein
VDSDDVENMLYMANLCPYQYGEVVSSARTFVHAFINDTLTFINPCEIGDIVPKLFDINENVIENEGIMVYPIPANESITLSSQLGEEANYQLYDMVGRILLQGKMFDMVQLNVVSLSEGNYIILIRSNNKSVSKKVIIKR